MLEQKTKRMAEVINGNSGGLVVRIQNTGVTGFVPFAQMGYRLRLRVLGAQADLEATAMSAAPLAEDAAAAQTKTLRRLAFTALIGRELEVSVINLDNGRVIMAAEEPKDKVDAVAALAALKVGDIVNAHVTGLTEYGAFCELTGTRVKGIIHISELAWGRVQHPSAVVRQGQLVRAVVVLVDTAKGKIALSLRRTQPDPLLLSLDTVIGSVTPGSRPVPPMPDIDRVCGLLRQQPDITEVTAGRASASTAYAPSLQVFLGGERLEARGMYTVIARKEFSVQEIVARAPSREALKAALERIMPDL